MLGVPVSTYFIGLVSSCLSRVGNVLLHTRRKFPLALS